MRSGSPRTDAVLASLHLRIRRMTAAVIAAEAHTPDHGRADDDTGEDERDEPGHADPDREANAHDPQGMTRSRARCTVRASGALLHISAVRTRASLSVVVHDADRPPHADLLFAALRQIGKRELSFTQLVALQYLAGRSGATVGEVARPIDRSPAATSRLVDGLVRDGLLSREPVKDDRRAKTLRLTVAAKEFLNGIHRAHHERPHRGHAH